MTSPLITARARVPGLSLWFGRAKLFDDQIVISGWTWTGRHRHTIPLSQVDDAKWLPREDYGIVLYMQDDSRHLIDVKDRAGLWYWKLRGLIAPSPEPERTDVSEVVR